MTLLLCPSTVVVLPNAAAYNNKLTIYHKGLNEQTKLETWTRFNYDNVWFFGGKGAGINKGYDDANDVDVRIPYDANDNLNVNNFSLGDIIIKGEIKTAEEMFYTCENIYEMDFSNFDTSQVTDMTRMLRDCSSLESINISNIVT